MSSETIEEVSRRADEAEQVLQELIDIVGARWNGERWIVPLPCQEPVMADLAPEEMLRNGETCLILTHHDDLWHGEILDRTTRPRFCIHHGSDKENVRERALEIYDERIRSNKEA